MSRFHLRHFLSFLFLLFALAQVRCSLFGGGDPTAPKASGYKVAAPKNWKPMKLERGDYAYRTPTGNGVTVASSCERYSEAPLKVLTRQLLFGSRDIDYKKQEPMEIDGVEALYTSLSAKTEGVPIFMEIVVLSKLQCVFDISLVGKKQLNDSEMIEFLAFAKSFHYGSN